jgi:phosphotransferase system IIB component
MADIFVSYTSSDKNWAEWIGHELIRLGHEPHLHDWEISGGGDLMAWMERRHHDADHVLCVVSKTYLDKPYSSLERRAAQWAAAAERPNFVLPVFIEDCEPRTLLAILKRCELFGIGEETARERIETFLKPARRSAAQPSFPGRAAKLEETPRAAPAFPGKPFAQSNITISVPEHFLGRDADMAVIEAALARYEGRVAITALHGLRGVGKTTLAAAYAEKHKSDYHATWWLRAQSESTLRADLVGLGVRLEWVTADSQEEAAVGAVLERLRHEGGGILLIYDNAIDADSLRPFLPVGGAAKILVTSNAHNWRKVAAPVEIKLWPKEIGADFLTARTGRRDRATAEALSHALHGLPLAHEQAAAYCEDLNVGFADYLKRFEAEPVVLLAEEEYAPQEHNDRQTVAKSFALGIEQAKERHPAAEALILYAAQLAAEPIPLYFFIGGREELGEPFAALTEAELDKAIAALRRFALVDLDEIEDERDPEIKTKTLRLHRLVRFVAGARLKGEAREAARRGLIQAMVAVYPREVFSDFKAWPRARRLDALALPLVEHDAPTLGAAVTLLSILAQYREAALGAYRAALPLKEKALALAEQIYPPDHSTIAACLCNLSDLLRSLGGTENLEQASAHLSRALAIDEKALGPEHPDFAIRLSVLGLVLQGLGGTENLEKASAHLSRALAIDEKALGPEHPTVAICLSNLATVLRDLGGAENLEQAGAHLSRALAIDEKALRPEHPNVAIRLSNLAMVLRSLGGAENLEQAGAHLSRALAIDQKALGPEHPNVAIRLWNLAGVLDDIGGAENIARARENLLRAEKIFRQTLGDEHPHTQGVAANFATFRAKHGDG